MAKRAPPHTPASRPWTDAELDQLVHAWHDNDAAAFERVGAAIGVVFTVDQLAKLERRGKLERRTVMLALGDAMSSEHGIGLRDKQAYMSTEVCLAAVANGTLYAVTGHTNNKGDGPAQLWGWLKPWYRDLAKNRARIELWLAKQLPDRLELPITAQPPAPIAVNETLALRAAIVAAPDDDTPRLVLADLLQQQGDAHGELIALQLGTSDADRVATLLDEHGERIAGDTAAHAAKYEIRRGFVDSVTMSAPKFATHGTRLFHEHPIRELVLRPLRGPALAKLASTPALARVRALTLSHDEPTTVETALSPILGSPQLGALETLRLVNLIASDWGESFAALRAPRLRLVEIEHGNFHVDALLTLLANPTLPPLALVLASWKGGPWTADNVAAIAESLGNGRVTSLTVVEHANLFKPAHWAAMFSAGTAIESLTVRSAAFDNAALAAIAGPPTLRSLTCTLSAVDAIGLARFLASPAGSRLERLFPWTRLIKPASLHDLLVRLPASHPLRYVAGFAHGARFVDANTTDHPEAARRYWHPI